MEPKALKVRGPAFSLTACGPYNAGPEAMVARANGSDVVWIYAMPAWLFMLMCLCVSSAVAVGALRLVRPAVKWERIQHNDVAGPVLATIGTVLAVMMSFMVAGVWQEYDQAAQTAQTEAGAISDLHHLAHSFPPNVETRLQAGLDHYATLVVREEWPMMRQGGQSLRAHNAAYEIEKILLHYKPGEPFQQGLQQRALDTAAIMLDARRNRILDNRQGIPTVLWVTLLLLGLITVAFAFYFRVANATAHYIMVGVLASVIALTFALIAELDFPFRGDIAVSPAAFTEVLQMLHPGGRLHG